MSKYSALIKRASNATAALALTLASLTPAVMLGGSAEAAQLTSRSIDMSSSLKGATNVTYVVNFTAIGVGADEVVIDFCSNSPLIGTACTAPTGFSLTSATAADYTKAPESTASTLILTKNSGSLSGASTITISGVTNPTDMDGVNEGNQAGTFYARILTYTESAASYDDETPGSRVDDGGIALSTTEDITINARVQEQLTFCVGAAGTAAFSTLTTCDYSAGTVDLGVIGTTAVASPRSSAVGGNNTNGYFLVATNAVNGVDVSYVSPDKLKVSGATCIGTFTDQCFENANSSDVGNSLELFGMRIKTFYANGSELTKNMRAEADYGGVYWNEEKVGGAGYEDATLDYHWDTSAEDLVASSKASSVKVVDVEVAELEFKISTKATTPTGFYSTTANFVATPSF